MGKVGSDRSHLLRQERHELPRVWYARSLRADDQYQGFRSRRPHRSARHADWRTMGAGQRPRGDHPMNGYKRGPYYGERQRSQYYNGALYTVVKVRGHYNHTSVYGGSNGVTADTRKFRHSVRLAYWPKLSMS